MTTLYNRRNTCLVVGGLIFYHILVTGLCAFFVYKFLVLTYDPGVFFLLAMFVGMTVLCDILLHKFQIFDRFLMYCRTDAEGLHCHLLGAKRWKILWKDICIFGITGYSLPTQTGIIFLSSDKNEKYKRESITGISRKRIVFEADEKIWNKICTHMPNDMEGKLRSAMNAKQDCFYRR